jgi:hypothetical protein
MERCNSPAGEIAYGARGTMQFDQKPHPFFSEV